VGVLRLVVHGGVELLEELAPLLLDHLFGKAPVFGQGRLEKHLADQGEGLLRDPRLREEPLRRHDELEHQAFGRPDPHEVGAQVGAEEFEKAAFDEEAGGVPPGAAPQHLGQQSVRRRPAVEGNPQGHAHEHRLELVRLPEGHVGEALASRLHHEGVGLLPRRHVPSPSSVVQEAIFRPAISSANSGPSSVSFSRSTRAISSSLSRLASRMLLARS
jgi:hypothetical protein